MKTATVFFPFDLFGSGGAGQGANLLCDALQEMLADNRRERLPTRALAYADKVVLRQLKLETMVDYENWRPQARKAARRGLAGDGFLFWVTGNHLGTLPVYDELADAAEETLVIQFDGHLDIYNLSDCTSELSHGNFLLHCEGPLPILVNLGNRELLLRPDYIATYYRQSFSAADLARDCEPALHYLREACRNAGRVFFDLDCDVFDPAFFPAVTHPLPFGLSPALILRFLDATWSHKVRGVMISEFDPGRDDRDRSLALLVWLMEFVLLKCHE